jgi:hypothetical protein
MKRIEFGRLCKPDKFNKQKVSYTDYDYNKLITAEAFIELEDNMPMYYGKLENIPDSLRYRLGQLKYSKSKRANGVESNNVVLFGSKPANPRKENFCHQAPIMYNSGEHYATIIETAQVMDKAFERAMPSYYKLAQGLLSLNKPDRHIYPRFMIPGTIYTTGIINLNNQLIYHYDRANMNGFLSVLLTLRGGMGGGYLVFPEYRMAVECKDGYILIFNGHKLLHGVSQLMPSKMAANPYRYSIVCYTWRNMTKCYETQGEALLHAQNFSDRTKKL